MASYVEKLLEMYRRGEYEPLSSEDALEMTKEMYKILDEAGINIIRVGLKSTDLITEGGEICGNTYHPAFRQLVEGEIAKEQLEVQLLQMLDDHQDFEFRCNGVSFSNMIGNSRCNKTYFERNYPQCKIRFKTDSSIEVGRYTVVKYLSK